MAIVTTYSIYTHIPKTGGSYVRKVLNMLDLGAKEEGHAHDPVYLLNIDNIEKYLKFTFVRNPISWIKSIWSHWKANSGCRVNNSSKLKEGKIYSYKTYSGAMLDFINDDLNETVNILISKYPGYITKMFKDYALGCEDELTITENKKENVYGANNNTKIDDKLKEKLYKSEIEIFEDYGYEV
jgi:hypothetical protein